MKKTLLVHKCDRCDANMSSKRPPAYQLVISAPGYRQRSDTYDLCSDCKEKLDLFISQKLYKHAFAEFTLPCPHHVPCADPNGCQGKAYRRAW